MSKVDTTIDHGNHQSPSIRLLWTMTQPHLHPIKALARRYLDGSLHFCYQQQELTYTILPGRPQPAAKPLKHKPRPKTD